MNRHFVPSAAVALPLVVTAVAFAACGGSEGASSAGPMPSVAATTTAGAAETTPRTTDAAPTAATATVPELEDGRHFGFIKSVDLAYRLSGDEANRAAAERGYPTPVDNDYFVVNDNPKLRTLALAPVAQISLLDMRRCCIETIEVRPERFASFFGRPKPGRYAQGEYADYWVTVEDGVVVKIEQQFVP